MTVCIAATCDNGENIVTATDGLLSAGDVTGDIILGKMLWYGDWLFLYAGIPAYFNLIMEEVEAMGADNHDALSRRRIQQTVRVAYRKFAARLSSRESLDPFDMTMEEFKETGLKVFGEQFHGELLRTISQRATQINEQLLVIGWGKSPLSVMIYEVSATADWLHTAGGFACIGSGAQIAQSMLLTLGQARHRTLAETMFNVACAKFASEKSSGLDVGQMTTMYVSRKRSADDDPSKLCGDFIEPKDVDALRALWEEHLKPRIPDEARLVISGIGTRINRGKTNLRDVAETINAITRMNAHDAVLAKPPVSQDPQPPTADPTPQPPSQE